MATCGKCTSFFKIPESDFDYEEGKGDCVQQNQDQKGKYWVSKPAFEEDAGCERMSPRR